VKSAVLEPGDVHKQRSGFFLVFGESRRGEEEEKAVELLGEASLDQVRKKEKEVLGTRDEKRRR